ncbi:MAG: hypothetical protein O2807_07915 [bacterium]|nr:hypothetical protein [bacterium]
MSEEKSKKHPWSDKIWERQKNPWGWVLRLFFLITMCFAAWTHNWLSLIFSALGLATCPFWFDPPRRIPRWAEQAIAKELQRLEQPPGGMRVIENFAGVILLAFALVSFWRRELGTGVFVLEIILFYKLIWSVIIMRETSWLVGFFLLIAIIALFALALAGGTPAGP